MRINRLLIVVFFALISIKGNAQTPAPKTWLGYKNSEYSILYPPQWKLNHEGLMGTKFILSSAPDSGGLRAKISLTMQNEPGEQLPIDSILKINEIQLPMAIENFKLESEKVLTIHNTPCYRMIFSGTQGGKNVRWMQQGCVIDHNFYVLTYTCIHNFFDKHLQDALGVADNIEFVKP